jgi:hypothetical protein
LAELLLPYLDRTVDAVPDHVVGWRFVDAPPALVSEALAMVGEEFGARRPNDQPPANWLVAQAEQLEGRLGGSVHPAPGWIRVDAICVPVADARGLAVAVDQSFPGSAAATPALSLALAEAWETWESTTALWEAHGRDLLVATPPGTVIGLWWD